MTWTDLLNKRLVQTHKTSSGEIESLRALIERDIKDAQIVDLSIDRQFATAYGAAVNLARMAVFCAGYRILSAAGHHHTSFEAAKIALGSEGLDLCSYFDTCRRKRNKIDYDFAQVANESEVEDLISQVLKFQKLIDKWIEKNHPHL
jgi:hypothetical protein